MSSSRYRGLSGPPGDRIRCPVAGCSFTRARNSDVQKHVRDAHSAVRLSQEQLDAIGAMYCDLCDVYVCSTHNNGAAHKSKCRAERNAPAGRPDASHGPQARGRSRSRSPGARRQAVSTPPVLPATEPFSQPAMAPGPGPTPNSEHYEGPVGAPVGAAITNVTDQHIDVNDVVPGVEELDLSTTDSAMRVSNAAPTEPAAPPPAVPRPAQPSAVSPVCPEIRPAPFVPYQSRFRFGEVTGHLLQLCKDAAHRGAGVGFSEAIDLLLQLPGLVLCGGAGRSRARKFNKRLELLAAGRMEELSPRGCSPQSTTPQPASGRRSRAEAAASAARAQTAAARERAAERSGAGSYRYGGGD
jgi:hypothetical protein